MIIRNMFVASKTQVNKTLYIFTYCTKVYYIKSTQLHALSRVYLNNDLETPFGRFGIATEAHRRPRTAETKENVLPTP